MVVSYRGRRPLAPPRCGIIANMAAVRSEDTMACKDRAERCIIEQGGVTCAHLVIVHRNNLSASKVLPTRAD